MPDFKTIFIKQLLCFKSWNTSVDRAKSMLNLCSVWGRENRYALNKETNDTISVIGKTRKQYPEYRGCSKISFIFNVDSHLVLFMYHYLCSGWIIKINLIFTFIYSWLQAKWTTKLIWFHQNKNNSILKIQVLCSCHNRSLWKHTAWFLGSDSWLRLTFIA